MLGVMAFTLASFLYAAAGDAISCLPGVDCLAHDDSPSVALLQRAASARVPTKKMGLVQLVDPNTTQATEDDFALSPEASASVALVGLILVLGVSMIQQRRYISQEDELKEEATEKTKRLAKQHMGLALAMDKDNDKILFQRQNIILAVRAGVGTVLASLITLWPSLAQWFTNIGYEHKYAAVLVLWCMGKSIGATVSDLVDANVGTILAFIFMFIIEGFYPGGYYEGDPTQKWLIGAAYLVLTTLFMMFGAWRNGVRVWCLSYHLGNMMVWLQPSPVGTASTFSPGLHFTARDASFGYVIITLISSAICLICLSLPVPRMAHRMALKSMMSSADAFESLFRSTVKIYAGVAAGNSSCNLERTRLFSGRLEDELQELQGHIAASWWEHFDIGSFADVRRALDKHVIVAKGLNDCISSMRVSLTFEAGDFKQHHTDLVAQIQAPLDKLVDSSMALYTACTKATSDGSIDDAEADTMTKTIAVVEADIEALSSDFRAACQKVGGASFSKQHESLSADWEFIFITCSLARLIADLGKQHVKRHFRTPVSVFDAMKGFSLLSGLSDPCHLEFASRNSLSLALCWAFGYVGLFGQIPAFSSGIASNASLLLSTSVGSALKKNMGRVQGLVVGTTVGSLLYGLIASQGCGTTGYFAMGFAVTFMFASSSFFLFLSTKEYSFIFYLFAGFGVQKFLRVCHANPTDEELAGYFQAILQAIVCVTILACVDLGLSPPATKEAERSAMEFMKSVTHSITLSLSDSDVPRTHSNAIMQGQLLNTQSKAAEGYLEPRLLSMPFQYDLYVSLCATGRSMLTSILTYRWALRHNASSTLEDAPAELKIGDRKVFPLLQKCEHYSKVHDGFAQMLDTLVIAVESQVVADCAVESVRATLDVDLKADEQLAAIDDLATELGPVVEEAKFERVALDKDLDASIHVILSVLEVYVKLANKLETGLQSLA